MPKKKEKVVTPDLCSHIERIPITWRGQVLGGFGGMGKCENDCLPGMTVCHAHANRDAMVMRIETFAKEIEKLKEEVETLKVRKGGRNAARIQ
jgi:hypothetical protein